MGMKISPVSFGNSQKHSLTSNNKTPFYKKIKGLLADTFTTNPIKLKDDFYSPQNVKDRIEFLKTKDLDEEYAFKYATKTPEYQYNKLLFLLDLGLSTFEIDLALSLDDKTYQRFLDLFFSGVDGHEINKFINLDDSQYKKYKNLASLGIDSFFISDILEYSDSDYKDFLGFIKDGIDADKAICMVKLDKENREEFLNLVAQDIDSDVAFDIADYEPEIKETFYNMFYEGIPAKTASNLVYFEGENFEKLRNYALQNIINDDWDFAQIQDSLNEDKFDLRVVDNPKLKNLFLITDVQPNDFEFICSLNDDELAELEDLVYDIELLDSFFKYSSVKDLFLNRNKFDYQDIIDNYHDKYAFQIQKLQNGFEPVLLGRSVVYNAFGNQKKHKETKTIIILPNGKEIKNVLLKNKNKISNWDFKTSKRQIYHTLNPDKSIKNRTEIIFDKNNEPDKIIYTSKSPYIEGVFDESVYELKNYPQSFDIISMLENNALENGKALAATQKISPVSTVHFENFDRNGCKITRKYAQYKNKNDELVKYRYSYKIKDENNKPILDLDRTWKKNQDGSTISIINGKEFRAEFDDNEMTIKLKLPNGFEDEIDLSDILFNLSDYYGDKRKELMDKFKTYDNFQRKTFEFLKTLPADIISNVLLFADKLQINPQDDNDGAFMQGDESQMRGIETNLSNITICHELGHAYDFAGNSSYETGLISSNPDLIAIYNDEMIKFMQEYPLLDQDVIEYFSPNGGTIDTGLAEMVAESNLLFTTMLADDLTAERSYYLVKYFPKTIAKISQLMDEENKKIYSKIPSENKG